jgi:uroporphyrinogen-III decarboxylase
LKDGSAEDIANETKRILDEVLPVSKTFVMRDANNVAPGTSPENIQVMFDTVKKYGVYKK